jgi:UPF0042 nucleotide-binding protein
VAGGGFPVARPRYSPPTTDMPFHVVIITGLSGSGMSSAGKAFEDLGYFSVDNLPPQLIPTFVDLCEQASSEITRAAIVVETLQRRYSETRRPHPLAIPGVLAALRREREELAPIRELADEVIDTTDLTIHDLRQAIRNRFSPAEASRLAVTVTSFGFKRGTPRDLDLLFDVRFLPNPHFVPELRPLTGKDEPIVRYLESQPEVTETLERLVDLLRFLVPRYQREGKSYLRIGIGCTGGQHRSVYVAEAIAKRLAETGVDARAEHRDVDV